jgi:hypothetical protein
MGHTAGVTTRADYAQRAGNRPRPATLSGRAESNPLRTRAAAASTSSVVFADVSEHQGRPVDNSYPFPILSFRLDTGFRTDRLAAENLLRSRRMLDAGRLSLVIGYVVMLPGTNAAVMRRVTQLMGTHCPSGFAFRVDVESGPGFAGPGDHSAQANDLVRQLAIYAGDDPADPKHVEGYGNAPDLASCWPGRPLALKVCTARYDDEDPGSYSQQYYGGLDYPVPAGLPRTCPPWGSWVDLNVTRRPLSQILLDYGIRSAPLPTRDWLDMATKDDVAAVVRSQGNHPTCMKFVGCGAKNNERAVYLFTDGKLLLLNAQTYTALGNPPVRVMGSWSTFWNLPVVAGTTDLRGK